MDIIDSIINGLVILGFGSFVLYFILVNYRSAKHSNTPVETDQAQVACKHPEMEPVLLGRHSTYVRYITFHTDSGDILKLYMNPTSYHSIPEDSRGTLTWQGDRFWSFILENGKEIRQ